MSDETSVQDWRQMVPPIFAACVAEESGRYQLDRPWTERGKVYATNGRMAVRGPVSLVTGTLPQPDGDYRFPPVDEGMEPPSTFVETPTPLPAIDESTVARQQCPKCRGQGLCNNCDCGAEHECGNCDGMGDFPADSIRTVIDENANYGLSHVLIYKLRKAGVDHVFLRKDGRRDRPCRFVWGECEGVVMPMAATN